MCWNQACPLRDKCARSLQKEDPPGIHTLKIVADLAPNASGVCESYIPDYDERSAMVELMNLMGSQIYQGQAAYG